MSTFFFCLLFNEKYDIICNTKGDEVMKIININELIFKNNRLIGNGNFGIVKECQYNGKNYAYKELYEPSTILTPMNIYKFDCLSKLNKEYLEIPRFLIEKDKRNIGYLTEYINDDVIAKSIGKKPEIIIPKLKKIKENLEEMHKLGIVHCDIHLLNIVGDKFIDFDGSCYQNIRPSYGVIAPAYNRYGPTPEFDIAMFNLLTYQLLFGYDLGINALIGISNEDFGNFNDEQIEICENLIYDEKPTKKYLIDTLR